MAAIELDRVCVCACALRASSQALYLWMPLVLVPFLRPPEQSLAPTVSRLLHPVDGGGDHAGDPSPKGPRLSQLSRLHCEVEQSRVCYSVKARNGLACQHMHDTNHKRARGAHSLVGMLGLHDLRDSECWMHVEYR